MASKRKWIGKATANSHGQFAAKAKAAGESTREFAAEKSGAAGRLGKQARLAETLIGMHKGKSESRGTRWYGKKD